MKYLLALLVPVVGYFSLMSEGWWSFTAIFFAFGVVTITDLLIGTRKLRWTAEKERTRSSRHTYRILLYSMLPIQYGAVWLYLNTVAASPDLLTSIGITYSMGALCGVIGINVAHELGHKKGILDQAIAQTLLLSSFYTHFFIEHNQGHHKNVGKPGEPGTAARSESLYAFYVRAVINVYRHAWKLEISRLNKSNLPFWSIENRMIKYLFIQVVYSLIIILGFGVTVFLWYLLAALLGILLLESINYIEHYGLARKELKPGIFESVSPRHSWNSDHWFSKTLLFELPLHPDHHMYGSKQYQVLNSQDEAPQMPLGYSAMILMALVPPLWFRVMHRRLDKLGGSVTNGS